MPDGIRQSDSFTAIHKLCTVNNNDRNPYMYGINRRLNLIHSQLRMNSSNLNEHLYGLHVINSPLCSVCVNKIENCYHYFFVCPLFNRQRRQLFSKLLELLPSIELDVLLLGRNNLSDEINKEILIHVEKYLLDSKHFD